MAEPQIVEEPEFKWGRKSGTGGKQKNIQFYESFTYDDVEYFRYDCVYLYEEGEPKPSVGKLIKVWETCDKKKKGKVLWFFRPSEISNFIGGIVTLENELFLASGEGCGLADINPLEAIAGKCNVVCISKDSRNRQPTIEEIENAEYVFRRTFDVGCCKIRDEMDETIAGTDVKLLLNGADPGGDCSTSKVDSERKEVSQNVVQNSSCVVPSVGNISKEREAVKTNGHCNDNTTKEAAKLNDLLEIPGSSTTEKRAADPLVEQGNATKTNQIKENVSASKGLSRSNVGSRNSEDIKVKRAKESVALEEGLSKKAKLSSHANGGETVLPNASAIDEVGVKPPKDSPRTEKASSERLKLGNKTSVVSNGKLPKVCSQQAHNEDHKKEGQQLERLKLGNKTSVVSSGKLPKVCSQQAHNEDHKKEGQQLERTSKPDAGTSKPDPDRSKWFSGLPWEDKIRAAHEKGSLVLLQNLDPSYTSAEVEDIVKQGFNESCSAQMIQRTAFSSPDFGQAFVIFKRKDIAKTVVEKLDKDCLLLPNGRPLLGIRASPCFPEKKPVFPGHLSIDKRRQQMTREQRDAVSTSHCSQPNTVEYDMALEWFLLQEKSKFGWKKLFEKQSQDLKKLKAVLKRR